MIACAPHVVLGLVLIVGAVGVGLGVVIGSRLRDRAWWEGLARAERVRRSAR